MVWLLSRFNLLFKLALDKLRPPISTTQLTIFTKSNHPPPHQQGTLYPDVIESCPPPGSGQKHSHTIKSHHNVGGLPEDLQFELVEPLRSLFKDEVRALGRLLGVPERFIARHPFPGPGLAVRVLGDVTAGDALQVLREVDEVFVEAIKEWGLYDEIWQAFAVFLPIRSVGALAVDLVWLGVVGFCLAFVSVD